MAAQPPTLHFLPWVRQGAAADIRNPDTLRPDQDAVIKLPVDLWINRNSGTPDVSVTAQLYGPGDVTGIDPQQVVRTEPHPMTSNFEANLFPAIEFDRPDFPWLFTPLSEGANDQLRPWLVLVVVKKQDGVTLNSQPSAPLPVLAIKAPARPGEELPDVREAHAWAHAQVTVDGTTDVAAALHSRPERTLSRLLCPRRLEPNTAYLACVVPAFAVGRDTGLGLSQPASAPAQPATTPKLAPAWTPTDTAVTLPVYYSWEFSTGQAGDFEALAQQLRARPLPDGVGQQRLDISRAGSGLPVLENAVLPFAGALLPLSAPEPAAVSLPAWQGSLQKILNAPDDMQAPTPSGTAIQAMRDPLLAPPLYGGTHAAVTRVDSSQMQAWPNELNLDPRQRVTAALGTQVVQREQEPLMAAAWEQLEAVQAANQARRLHQLAQATHDTLLDNTVRHLSEDDLLQMTAPAHTRLAMSGSTTTFYAQMQMQRGTTTAPYLGNARDLRSTALRRVTRPRGAINRRFLPAGVRQAQSRPLMAFLQTPAALPVQPGSPNYMPYFTPRIIRGAMVTLAAMYPEEQTPQRFFGTEAEIRGAPGGYYSWIWAATGNQAQAQGFSGGHWELVSAAFDRDFRDAAVAQLSRLQRPGGVTALTAFASPITPGALLAQLRGATPVTALTSNGVHTATPNTDMILAHPEFPQPMYEPLRELAPEYLLPGLEHVPPNTAVLIKTNPTFIEAFMAGLNTEMARELLWREYPTDQRGTCFHHFWDTRGASEAQTRDIDDLHHWTRPLGHNKPGSAQPEQIVLLLRGELLRRYPGAIIYAVRAIGQPGQLRPSTQASDQVYPLFRGALPPDVTFLGFPLTETDVLAQPGWFFVIQQQPGEPQFGFDEANGFGDEAANLNALSWGHLVSDAVALQALHHVSLQRSPNGLPKTGGFPPGVEWGKNAAHMARITLQRPVRVAIHSAQMLTPG